MVILDPIQAHVGVDINMNNANEARNVMAQLGRIAEKYDYAVLLVGHMNKGSGNKSFTGKYTVLTDDCEKLTTLAKQSDLAVPEAKKLREEDQHLTRQIWSLQPGSFTVKNSHIRADGKVKTVS